jgi:hypothetical protein
LSFFHLTRCHTPSTYLWGYCTRKDIRYLASFEWKAGQWKYSSIQDTPANLYVFDLEGNSRLIKRYETWEAQETLGMHLAPDGNTSEQTDKMKYLATQWADSITGRISRSEAWLAIISTILRTLAYPVPALNLSKEQCEAIMRPILNYGLPAMGICQHFPRDIVYAPPLYRGIGFQNLHTLQEILRIRDLISHTSLSLTTGKLCTMSLELLLIEAGLGSEVHRISTAYLNQLCTNTLIKSTCLFLNEFHLEP